MNFSPVLRCVCFFDGVVHSNLDAFTITSESTRINGIWREDVSYREPNDGNYVTVQNNGAFDVTSGSFVFDSPYKSLNASANVSAFSISLSGHAAERNYPYLQGPNGTKLVLQPHWSNAEMPVPLIDTINVTALATTRFTTESSVLTFGLSAQVAFDYFKEEQDVRLAVKDLTSNTLLLDLVLQRPYNALGISGSYSIAVQPLREYELVFGGSARVFDGKDVVMTAQLTVQDVPDYGSSLTLFVAAIGLLLWRKRFGQY
jgi:hypothetical protein